MGEKVRWPEDVVQAWANYGPGVMCGLFLIQPVTTDSLTWLGEQEGRYRNNNNNLITLKMKITESLSRYQSKQTYTL